MTCTSELWCAQMRGSKGDITAYYPWPCVATARSLRWGPGGVSLHTLPVAMIGGMVVRPAPEIFV